MVPIIGTLAAKVRAFRMILVGATISGISPVFLLMGPHIWCAVLWVFVLSVGEAIWSPRLYEYSASIAPKGKEGTYLTLASVPLFLAPVIAGSMSGDILQRYCPARYHCDSFGLWLPVVIVSVSTPVLLVMFSPCLESDISEAAFELPDDADLGEDRPLVGDMSDDSGDDVGDSRTIGSSGRLFRSRIRPGDGGEAGTGSTVAMV